MLVDLLNRSFRSRIPGVREVLGLGLEVVDRLGPVRGWFARQAVGV
jgi:2-polyprenyl-6-methoxyphenol hydroxylase-like FAD-dependent oxidoreductase